MCCGERVAEGRGDCVVRLRIRYSMVGGVARYGGGDGALRERRWGPMVGDLLAMGGEMVPYGRGDGALW